MGTASLLSADDKAKVKKAIPTSSSTNKIVAGAVARVYVAKAGASTWNYSGATGALTFVADKARGSLWFRVVDLAGSRGVIWEHELPNEIEYTQDKPFFHSWVGDDATIGFVFASEQEAHEFYKKVANRSKYAVKSKTGAEGEKKSLGKRIMGRIDKAMISKPKEFKHVSHMGYDAEKGFSSHNVDKSWQVLLEQLSMKGVSAKDIEKNEAFIKDYVAQQGGIESLVNGGGIGEASPAVPAAPKRGPPPPPTSRRKPAPAPPPSRTSAPEAPPPPPPGPSPARASLAPEAPPPPPPGPSPARTAPATPIPPPPPPPPGPSPARTAPATPVPPPPPPPPAPPARAPAAPSAPPPPPPPPPSAPSRTPAAPPPPPPPPPGRTGAPPPPPPPPPSAPSAPPPPPPGPPPAARPAAGGGDARSALLASIQGQGVHKLRKVDDSEKHISPAAGGAIAAGAAATGVGVAAVASPTDGGGGLADSLAAALAQRKADLGDSDEEDEDSDDDW